MRRFNAARGAANTGAPPGVRGGAYGRVPGDAQIDGATTEGAPAAPRSARRAPVLPPLLPSADPATPASVPVPTMPAPAPAIAAPTAALHDVTPTVEMPAVPAPQPAERTMVIPAAPEANGSRRRGLAMPRLRRSAAPAKVDLLPPGAELPRLEDMRRPFRRPMTVLVANPKGGSGKTAVTLLLSGTLSLMRGGHVLAWDNHESRGGLAFRATQRGISRAGSDLTVRDLLADLSLFETHQAGMGELAAYLRPQDELFDVLAADDDPTSLAQIRSADFARLHQMLRRYYRVLVLDSGNNVRSEAWQAAALAADCLVLPSTYDADSVAAAEWTLEHLTAIGRGDLVDRAVTVLTAAGGRPDPTQQAEVCGRFAARTAEVIEIAHDPRLRSAERVGRATVSESTVGSVIRAAQAVVAQLCLVDEHSGVAATDEAAAGRPWPTVDFEEAAAEALALVEHSGRRPAPAPEPNPAPVVTPVVPLSLVPQPTEPDETSDSTVVDLAKVAAAKVVAAQSAPPKRRAATARTATTRPAAAPSGAKAEAPRPRTAKASSAKATASKPTTTKASAAKTSTARTAAPKPRATKDSAAPRTRRPAAAKPAADELTPTVVELPLAEEVTALREAVEEITQLVEQTSAVAPKAVGTQRAIKAPKNTRRIAKPRTDAPVPDTPPVTDAPVTGAGESDEAVSIDVPMLLPATTAAGLPGTTQRSRS